MNIIYIGISIQYGLSAEDYNKPISLALSTA